MTKGLFKTLAYLAFPLAILSCGKTEKNTPLTEPVPTLFDGGLEGDWFNSSSPEGGAGINEAYEVLKNLAPVQEIIVAVIDSGLDVYHEDLKGSVWVNPKEIPNNGIDDNGDGYIDDVNGWNYLVDKDGNNIVVETAEVTREMRRLSQLSETQSLSDEDRVYFEEIKAEYTKYSVHQDLKRHYDLKWQQRGDDLNNFIPISSTNPAYGNGDVQDRNGHGTAVAGIIAANRSNDIGIKGVAQNIKIMALRVVPNGDEQDKDIYHAVRYATDHGAHIINMSFSKEFSPYKDKVQEAFQYARDHGVLLVHAAGNSGKNIDQSHVYPSRLTYQGSAFLDSWLEVAASSKQQNPDRYPSSSFSKVNVDLFAPGQEILSCTPNNSYAAKTGTSMAAPVVSGVAALIMAYDPELSASQIRDIILQTVRMTRTDGGSLALREMSLSGGVVDASALVKSHFALSLKK
jgi:subtilisin family serine protease